MPDIEKVLETYKLQSEIISLRELLDEGDPERIVEALETMLKDKEKALANALDGEKPSRSVKTASSTTAHKKKGTTKSKKNGTKNTAARRAHRKPEERQFDVRSLLLTAKDAGATYNQCLQTYGMTGGSYEEGEEFLDKLIKDGFVKEKIGQRACGKNAYKEIDVLVATPKIRSLIKESQISEAAAL